MSTEQNSQQYRGVLWADQRARIESLKAARDVLVDKQVGAPFAGNKSGAADPVDLINVAQYIMTGEDPWTESVLAFTTEPIEPEPETDDAVHA